MKPNEEEDESPTPKPSIQQNEIFLHLDSIDKKIRDERAPMMRSEEEIKKDMIKRMKVLFEEEDKK
jgi:hypothetical protein